MVELKVSRSACDDAGKKLSQELVDRGNMGVNALFGVESSGCGLLK